MAVPTEFYRWWITDERTGKRRRTTSKLTRADPAPIPGAEPDLGTRELREVREPGEERGNRETARHEGGRIARHCECTAGELLRLL